MLELALPRHVLDERDQALAKVIKAAWLDRPGMRVGDFVHWPNGEVRRCSYDWGDGMQTSKIDKGSFYIGRDAGVSFSGGLQPANPMEFFKPTDEIMDGRFWFFSHGRPGAGRGKDVTLPCRVYLLEPYAMSEEEAMRRPQMRRILQEWGKRSHVFRENLQALIDPPVLRDPDYY
ncbi:hypothetical protein [Hydrogenophaga sp. NFH-34]|uniref:hypothetical protein n=1 Tax=Hydrogenophaga sp. NFH-34 TaxID=2744446 RepID=UPI001F1AC786|nr:hypothetical protein [Hydrogenophaga sp. NFH-34]